MKLTTAILLLSVSALAQLPNHRLTPGAIRTTKASDICAPSFRTAKYRHTTASVKKHVCEAYGVKRCPREGEMEIDHLIPLELGGADVPENLWVEFAKYADGSPGFHVKDVLENELHRRVCRGEMSLPDAQRCLTRNWVQCSRAIDRNLH